ncbi:MAG: hypothetical protein Q7U75_13530, partial [Desulfobacterales bacterium]|nr:hypothetical protein [Desulfobacterales bacterium]
KTILSIAHFSFGFMLVVEWPNGKAQRQRRGRQDSLLLSRHFWQSAPDSRAAKSLSDGQLAFHGLYAPFCN